MHNMYEVLITPATISKEDFRKSKDRLDNACTVECHSDGKVKRYKSTPQGDSINYTPQGRITIITGK